MNILMVGGSGGIGLALVTRLLKVKPELIVYSTYRTKKPAIESDNLIWLEADVSKEADIQRLAQQIPSLHMLINAVGFLHQNDKLPEKSIDSFDVDFFQQNIQANTLPTMLLAKHFKSHLTGKYNTYFVSISAKIGSIDDNKIGGWISYRSSKAALNMAIKTLSIEWKYKLPNCCVLSFHPGTTNTELSKPFQARVPTKKLFTTEFVAQSLIDLIGNKSPQDSGKFFSYDGKEIPW